MNRPTSGSHPTQATLELPQRRVGLQTKGGGHGVVNGPHRLRSAWRRSGGRSCPVIVTVAAILLLQSGADAQRREVFAARLTAVPIDTVSVRTTTGSGSVTAVLEGTTLTLTGKFDGMNSPATVAHLHRARKGLRGPSLFDLTVTKATSGTLEGTLKLTATQIEDLDKGWYYVQIHTERNAEGHLRGWLLK
jgi:CHRD domain-containing protein